MRSCGLSRLPDQKFTRYLGEDPSHYQANMWRRIDTLP